MPNPSLPTITPLPELTPPSGAWLEEVKAPAPDALRELLHQFPEGPANKEEFQDALIQRIGLLQWSGSTWLPIHFEQWMALWQEQSKAIDFGRQTHDGCPLVFMLLREVGWAQDRFQEGKLYWGRWSAWVDTLVERGLAIDVVAANGEMALDRLAGATQEVYAEQIAKWIEHGGKFSAQPPSQAIALLDALWAAEDPRLDTRVPSSHETLIVALVHASKTPLSKHLKKWQIRLPLDRRSPLDPLLARVQSMELEDHTPVSPPGRAARL